MRDQPASLHVAMPGAFARLGPRFAEQFTTATGHASTFAAFRPSGVLATAILAGEPTDVFVSANVQWMRRVQRAGLVHHWATLAGTRLCIISLPDVVLAHLADLARPGLRVVAPEAATDPCGRYVELCWRQADMLGVMRVKQASGELLRAQPASRPCAGCSDQPRKPICVRPGLLAAQTTCGRRSSMVLEPVAACAASTQRPVSRPGMDVPWTWPGLERRKSLNGSATGAQRAGPWLCVHHFAEHRPARSPCVEVMLRR